MGVSEKEARQGTFVLFKVSGKAIKAKIRSMNDTEDWLDEAARVEELGANCNGRESQRKYNEALKDCVFSYDEELPRDELELQLTGADIFDAFEKLRVSTDPFLSRQSCEDKKRLLQLEESRLVLSAMSPVAQEQAMQMMLEGKLAI